MDSYHIVHVIIYCLLNFWTVICFKIFVMYIQKCLFNSQSCSVYVVYNQRTSIRGWLQFLLSKAKIKCFFISWEKSLTISSCIHVLGLKCTTNVYETTDLLFSTFFMIKKTGASKKVWCNSFNEIFKRNTAYMA